MGDKSKVDISVADIPVEEFLDKDVSAINLSSAPSLTILIDFEFLGQQSLYENASCPHGNLSNDERYC